jgi:anti-sigma B factor antagonist
MSSRPTFRIAVDSVEDTRVIRAVGEIDLSTAPRLRAALEAARAHGTTTLLDMSAVSFIDSNGLRVLLEAARAAERSEWGWFIVRPSATVRRLVAISRTSARLPIVAMDGRTAEPAVAPVVPLRVA